MIQQNTPTNVGTTDPNTGAVYTSSTNTTQGPGTSAGAVYTSGVNTSTSNTGFNTSGVTSGVSNSMNTVGTTTGTVNVQSINQQLQSIQNQLRQSTVNGAVSQVYTDAANRIQDAYDILNNIK